MFYKYVMDIEKDKLKYFSLIYDKKTVVIKSPSGNNEQKLFLGYYWTGRNGQEGIKISESGGALFNPDDRCDTSKIAHIVKSAFNENYDNIAARSQYCSLYQLRDLIDFQRIKFNKEIKTAENKITGIQSKYPLVFLCENDESKLIDIIRGVTYKKTDQTQHKTSNIVLPADNVTVNGFFELKKLVYLSESVSLPQEKRLMKNDLFMCFSSGSKNHIGKLSFIRENTNYYAGGFMGIIRVVSHKILPLYLFYVLNTKEYKEVIKWYSSGANINNLSNSIGEISIPLPTLEIQKQVVAELEKLFDHFTKTRMKSEDYLSELSSIMARYEIIL